MIATVGSAEKAVVTKAAGADHIILYREEDFVGRVHEITGGRGVDAAYDSVGRDTFLRSLDCLAFFRHSGELRLGIRPGRSLSAQPSGDTITLGLPTHHLPLSTEP